MIDLAADALAPIAVVLQRQHIADQPAATEHRPQQRALPGADIEHRDGLELQSDPQDQVEQAVIGGSSSGEEPVLLPQPRKLAQEQVAIDHLQSRFGGERARIAG